MNKKEAVSKFIELLDQEYPDAKCSLVTSNPLELLISTLLSAQCKDDRVNMVTGPLYAKYRSAEDFANADVEDIEHYIRSLGLYKNKAKNIVKCCQKIVSLYHGQVPQTMEELLTLDGIGRKTANLVLGDAFGIPGIVVDTHAIRLSNRMGLTKNKDPYKIEMDLKKIVLPEHQTRFCHMLVLHGRKYCTARKPDCEHCPLAEYCPKIIT